MNLRLPFPKNAEEAQKDETRRMILEEYDRRKRERLTFELRWRLNANFYAGNQYCDINIYRNNTLTQFPPEDEENERETFNRIAPIIETRAANLQKISYAMCVKPRRNDVDDAAKADVSTKILKYLQDTKNFEEIKNRAIMWNEICGSCFFVTGWNTSLGKVVATKSDENGACRPVREGDVEYALLSPYEIYPDDCMAQGIENQKSIMIVQVMTREDVYERYGIKTMGEAVDTFTVTPKPVNYGYGKEGSANCLVTAKKENAVRVITYYKRPCGTYPNGRCVIMLDIDDKPVVYDSSLVYGFIPIAEIHSKSVPGQFFGKSVIEDLIPLQRAYNGVKNCLHEYIKRVTFQAYAVEDGSVDIKDIETGFRPGKVIPYERGSRVPVPLSNSALPAEVSNELTRLERDMEYVAGISQLQMIGAAPNGVKSGTAIESLREIDNTRMAVTGEYIRSGVMNLGIMWLKMYNRFVKLPRVVEHTGFNGLGGALVWTGKDITSYEVDFEAENELVVSEEMQKQNFMMFMQMGFFTDSNGQIPQRVKNIGLEKGKIGSWSDLMDINSLQLQAAQRETEYMRRGVYCDINPYDDDEIHADEHKRFILSMEYEMLRARYPEYAKILLAHLEAHEARLAGQKTQKE